MTILDARDKLTKVECANFNGWLKSNMYSTSKMCKGTRFYDVYNTREVYERLRRDIITSKSDKLFYTYNTFFECVKKIMETEV